MWNRLIYTTNSAAPAILRLMLGIVFFAHGSQKVLGWWGGHGFSATLHGFEHSGIPTVFAGLAIAAEFLGGIGVIVGFLGRVAAFGIFCNMVVAVLKVHAPNGLFMNWTGQQKGEGFEYHLLAIAIAVVLVARGSGPWSVDRVLAEEQG